ncbi:hypothetical protein Tco_1054597 [Tanacetum coccineum]|uniref:DUF4283 domain-containing protein n=1 Tax=Tanacetum coccineum TaxID=301880 RepID=A0ABQ5GX91_9ASTR
MDASKRGSLPTQQNVTLRKTKGPSTPKEVKRMKRTPYDSVVGSIMYAVREAEYIAATEAAMESVWIRKFITRLGFSQPLEATVSVVDADLAIPLSSVNEVSNRFANSLYGYFIDGFFFFKINTKTGMEQVLENGPWIIKNVLMILNVWSPDASLKKEDLTRAPVWVKLHNVPIAAFTEDGLKSWGCISYARALIEINSEQVLKDDLVVAIPLLNILGYTKETVSIEYEWQPPRCESCKIFGHSDDQCPKKKSTKSNANDASTSQDVNLIRLENAFNALRNYSDDVTKHEDPKQVQQDASSSSKLGKDSDSEDVEDIYVKNNKYMEAEIVTSEPEGENTLINVVYNSHVATSRLEQLCSKVFWNWKWTSNGALCVKGSRIILGWNPDEVYIMILSQSSQVMHTQVIFKADRKPWCLMGDFNSALNLEDKASSSSIIDISMWEFKECVENIEVSDVNKSGLHFTWNQKPKGEGGLLKKIDRVMANLDFNDEFVGANALFQPYRISDHSPAILRVAGVSKFKPKPFKFSNLLLKLLKKPLRKLLYNKGNLHERVKSLRNELDELQRALDLDPSNLVLREEEVIYLQYFNDALLNEERFLKKKAKVV